MATRMLENQRWKPYFDAVTRELGAKQVEIEVTGVGLGDQVQTDWTPLHGVAYDPKNDLLEVMAGPVDHLIHHPREVYVEDDLEGLHSIRVIALEGHGEIIKLRTPMMLPMSE